MSGAARPHTVQTGQGVDFGGMYRLSTFASEDLGSAGTEVLDAEAGTFGGSLTSSPVVPAVAT